MNLLNLILFCSVQGCVKDHRLWVSSCKDDPPYPLIGELTCSKHYDVKERKILFPLQPLPFIPFQGALNKDSSRQIVSDNIYPKCACVKVV